MWSIRPAHAADAAPLAAFAARAFRSAFGADTTAEDMAAHVAASYTPARQAAEIADPAMTTGIAEANGQLAGYFQLRRAAAPRGVPGDAPIELQRFYVDAAWHGRGLAQALMAAAVSAAQVHGATTLWLGVWEHNPRAITFYRKMGFRDVGAQDFAVGSDVQRDLVLARSLDPASR